MNIIFVIRDKTDRDIRLTGEQWHHITTAHAEMSNYLDEIKQALKNPITITSHKIGNLSNYYFYIKNRQYPEKYLKAIVKYLNGEGFIVTAYFVRCIK